MNTCLIPSKNDILVSLKKICAEGVKIGGAKGKFNIKHQINELIQQAKNSPEPEAQTNLLRETIEEFYGASNPFGKFINNVLPLTSVLPLFDFNNTEVLPTEIPATKREAVATRQLRQNRFLETKFKGSPNAKLFFKRSALRDLVETFLVARSGDNPRYFASQTEMNENVRSYKQKLLDTVFKYFEKDPFLKRRLAAFDKKMYTGARNDQYTGVIEQIKEVVDSVLDPELFVGPDSRHLDDIYSDYRDSSTSTKEESKRLLEAYNAWIMLQNFDIVVSDIMGSVIKVHEQDINGHTGDNTKFEIKSKATNMWSTWLDSDDIADMADVVSDIAQYLVDTSRMYKWGSSEPYADRYVSFNDYNCVLGFIKRHAFSTLGDQIKLNELTGTSELSPYTNKVIVDILSWNRQNGYVEVNAVGESTQKAKAVTWKQLVSRMNENPQRYLHAIFDILCNTNILDKLKADKSIEINDYVKNIIWSFNKEVFGYGESNPRSLFRLHNMCRQNNIYPILTQLAASTFPEDYLQYYETVHGTFGTRLLKDFAIENIRRELLQEMQQIAATLTSKDYKKYGISYTARPNDSNFLQEISIDIKINDKLTFSVKANSDNVFMNRYTAEEYALIWNNSEVQNLFKNILGINFIGDPDFKAAYLEETGSLKNFSGAISDLSKILGRVVFSNVINNEFSWKYPNATTDSSALYTFIAKQFGDIKSAKYKKKTDVTTGLIPVIPVDLESSLLAHLANAKAINGNLLSAAQSTTGEGTALANYTLSRLRNCFHNQIEMQCKKAGSAVKNLTFNSNTSGLFEGILSRRELKTLNSSQQSTKFSDKQSMQLCFINDFVGGLIPNPDSQSYLKNGHVSFLPTVNSDKSQIDGLLVNLYAKSHIPDGKGGFKRYVELTDAEIEQEMSIEFKDMYNNIITNINNELTKVCDELLFINYPGFIMPVDVESESVITKHQKLLDAINNTFKDDASLGSKPKNRIIKGLHYLISSYNQTHSRNPIMLSEHVHYIFDSNGLLTSNKTLEALWGRFNPNLSADDKAHLNELYAEESDYQQFLMRNGLFDASSTSAFFKYQEHSTVRDLLNMKFSIALRGSDSIVRSDQPEIQFLKGEAKFTDEQLTDPAWQHMVALNSEMKNWVNESGMMILAKGIIDGVEVEITSVNDLNHATNLKVHPLLSKLNRLDYLCTQQYTVSTVGSHYVHKGKSVPGNVIAEEAQRWLASNKRNVAATSTVHLFQKNQLNGVPSVYNMAIIEDIKTDLYNVMGELYLEGHKPLDGGMFDNIWIAYLENNSLCGERGGLDKKPFGTYYDEKYAAGGIVKTAGFPPSNARMRRSQSWVNLQKNMSNRRWVKEHPNAMGEDIAEVVDITMCGYYNNEPINYKDAIKGQEIMYKRVAHDNPAEMAAYKLDHIESLGNNQYRIFEVEVDIHGEPVGKVEARKETITNPDGTVVETDVITIDNNWDLFTKVFGGYYSLELGSDRTLQWSENSNLLMVHAINNVGYRKDNTIDSENGLTQDEVWQPLKYSDIHCVPNIGAMKSLQYNVNPDGKAVLDKETSLNFFRMRMAQFGIQLDKEHHADMSEVSMPTQIIQALANKSYTSEYAKEAYEALAVLTGQAIEPYLNGISEIIHSEDHNPATLSEEITKLILDHLLKSEDEETSINAILADLSEKVRNGKKLKYTNDIEGKIPWSDPTIYSKIFSLISTSLTNVAIKMKFPGSLSVICPTEGIEKRYGDRSLDSFAPITTKEGSTRTPILEAELAKYQQSVIEGKEIDSNGRNLLVYDTTRDVYNPPPQKDGEPVEQYERRIKRDAARRKLSLVSELKTQHNYVIELSDGSKETITIDTPRDYFKVKNLILFGIRNANTSNLPEPFDYDAAYYRHLQAVESDIDIYDTKEGIVASYLSSPVLLQESVKKELGYGPSEIKSLFGLFKSKDKGGVSIEKLAEQIYGANPDKFADDYEVRNLIIEAIGSARTTKDFKSYGRIALEREALSRTEAEYDGYLRDIYETYQKSEEEYEAWYQQQIAPITVTKIYEDVTKGRSLGAYNVRFTDSSNGYRYQIYDLDSINLLFKLPQLITNKDKKVDGYKLFTELDISEQQQLLTQIFNSPVFDRLGIRTVVAQQLDLPNLPALDGNFVANMSMAYPGQLLTVVDAIYDAAKLSVYRVMQRDLFKLSDNYKGDNRAVFVNGKAVIPTEIETEAYELIMPQVYKTQFGLQEGDDVQEILADKDFFIKRGLKRFGCKFGKQSTDYDYEFKNFNGDHYYVLDVSEGIPEHLKGKIHPILTSEQKGKVYRIDSDDKVVYELSSKSDKVCMIDGVQVILTDNPMFYMQTLNYNTLKVNPNRVTKESYAKLIEHLEQSKRKNHANFLKAITKSNENGTTYLNLSEFKKLNIAIDALDYETVSYTPKTEDYKSVVQICRLILQNGRELHTSFKESLNVIAGRIPAQSQQSFMIQKVVGFDSSGLNTAMVSTFQLFLQGSDLDIDAVTLLGYEFDKNGKFIGWSPYFKSTSDAHLKASKKIPLPTGKKIEIEASTDAKTNFFEIYDKYFGTLFTTITLPSGEDKTKYKTVDGVLELQLNINTPENIELLAEFLRDVKQHGICIKAPVIQSGNRMVVDTDGDEEFFTAPEHFAEDGTVTTEWNLFRHRDVGGKIGIRPDQVYAVAQQLLKFVNDHNDYINTAESHLRMKMAKNYVVNYIYKVAASPCNQTEAMDSVDKATDVLHVEAARFAAESGENTHAPGRVTSKIDMVGKGQAGKSGVGIGAVGIKANSTTQFYLSEVWNYGTDEDRDKILFPGYGYTIGGKTYLGFANMYTTKNFSEEQQRRFDKAMSLLNELDSPDKVTLDVAKNIAAMLSIAVDNAKDLALAKINSGPKMMGMYVYGMTLGVPTTTLTKIMRSPEGMILAEMTEGSAFSNDTNAFRVLDVFDKLNGNIGRDLKSFEYTYKNDKGYAVKYTSKIKINGKNLIFKTTDDAVFAAMYENYVIWFNANKDKFPKRRGKGPELATTFNGMLQQLIQMNAFDVVYTNSVEQALIAYENKTFGDSLEARKNWVAARKQMVAFVKDIAYKANKMLSSVGQDLKVLAEGAEEMRVLGSILGINKGLKPTVAEAETFIETIENLIIDRKKILGMPTTSDDHIDFTLFMVDDSYKQEVIEKYEKVKHSVNIPHLLSKAPHFTGYLKTQLIPVTFFMQSSIKYRTLRKLRTDLYGTANQTLFDFFEATSKKDKEAILKGLEGAIQHQLFTGWLQTYRPNGSTLRFRVPEGFSYFTDRNRLVVAPKGGAVLSLTTEAGLASFKKYMEEVYLPSLTEDPNYKGNEFVKNLTKISYDKTASHTSVTTYSLPGDLMTRKGRQAELNSRMFADFQRLAGVGFQEDLGIANLSDALYLYAQYCYNGKKGQKSLMTLFDSVEARGTLAESFNNYVAQKDTEMNEVTKTLTTLNLSLEQVITWGAPAGSQYSSVKYAWTTGRGELGVSLRQKAEDVAMDEDTAAAMQDALESMDDDVKLPKPEKYGVYRPEYLSTQYDRMTKNYFLSPADITIQRDDLIMPMNLYDSEVKIGIKTVQNKVSGIQLSKELHDLIEQKIADGTITKFKSAAEFRQDLLSKIALVDIPYKVSLTSETKKEVDFGILQTIIDQHLNC